MDLPTIAASCAALISAITFFKSIRDKRFENIEKLIMTSEQRNERRFQEIGGRFQEMNSRFDKIESLIHFETTRIHKDLSEIKERLVFVETAMCFVDIIPDANLRSEAARKAWKTRRVKHQKKED